MSQEQIKPQPQKQDEEAVPGVPTPVPASASAQAQVQEVDDLLAEIDGVLETNAEEFVRGFVQKGGQ